MNTHKLVMWIVFLSIFAMAVKPSMDSDSWWHLRAGEWILEHRAVPQVDPFSYTRLGHPWQYPGWLVQVPMAWIYRSIGPGGLNLWTAAMVTLAFVFVWKAMSGGPFLKAFVIILAAAATGVYWAARPYLITFVLTAVYLYLLERDRWENNPASARRLLWLPLLMIVWANSHGGFATGFILLGVYGFAELAGWIGPAVVQGRRPKWVDARRLFRLIGIGVLMLAAVCINPSGPVMLLYPFKTISIGALGDFIQEWQSPDLQLRASQPFIWLILALVAALGASRRRLALADFLLAGGFLYMAFLAWRNVALFGLVAPVVITRHLAPALEALGHSYGYRPQPYAASRTQRRLNALLLMLIVLAVAARAAADFSPERNLEAVRQSLPVDAVAYLKSQELSGRIFNSYNWGGYLLWETPQHPVFIDGRTDLYNDEIIAQWLQILRAEPGWEAALKAWEVQIVLVEPSVPLAAQLTATGWQEAYRDEVAVMFTR